MRLRLAGVAVPVAAATLLAAAFTINESSPRPAEAQECVTPSPPLVGVWGSLGEDGLWLRVDVLPGVLDLGLALQLPPSGDMPPSLPADDCPEGTPAVTEPSPPLPPPPPPAPAATSGTPLGPRSVT